MPSLSTRLAYAAHKQKEVEKTAKEAEKRVREMGDRIGKLERDGKN